MEETTSILLTISGVLVFAGFWIWFLYMIFHFLVEKYEKKPLEYVSVEKRGNKNKINQNKNMENQQQSQLKESKSPQTKWNKLSITGFVFSIVSIFGLGLAGLIGFILGIVALTQIKHTKERGKGIAIAAIIIGAIWSFGVSILKQLIKAGY